MTPSITQSSMPAALPVDFHTRRIVRGELVEVQRKLDALDPTDELATTISDWKIRFLHKIGQNEEIEAHMKSFSEELVKTLEMSPLVQLPINRIDARHALIASLIHFLAAHQVVDTSPLDGAYQRILEIKNFSNATDSVDERVKRLRAKKALFAEKMKKAQKVEVTFASNIHSIQEIHQRFQNDTQAHLNRLEQIEKRLDNSNIQDIQAAQLEIEQGNERLKEQRDELLEQVSELKPFTDPKLRRELLKARRAAQALKKQNILDEEERQVRAQFDARMPYILAPINHIAGLNRKNITVIEARIENEEKRTERVEKEQMAALKKCDDEMLELDKDIIVLAKTQDNTKKEIAGIQNDQVQLEVATTELKKAIKKSQKKGNAFVQLGVVVGCALATWGAGVAFGETAAVITGSTGTSVVVGMQF